MVRAHHGPQKSRTLGTFFMELVLGFYFSLSVGDVSWCGDNTSKKKNSYQKNKFFEYFYCFVYLSRTARMTVFYI